MEERIQNLKKVHSENNKKEQGSSFRDSIANAFRIGTEFIAAVFVGICIGYALDKFSGLKLFFCLYFLYLGVWLVC